MITGDHAMTRQDQAGLNRTIPDQCGLTVGRCAACRHYGFLRLGRQKEKLSDPVNVALRR
jgi:hypothetical protein